jgi:hypothetical protein
MPAVIAQVNECQQGQDEEKPKGLGIFKTQFDNVDLGFKIEH